MCLNSSPQVCILNVLLSVQPSPQSLFVYLISLCYSYKVRKIIDLYKYGCNAVDHVFSLLFGIYGIYGGGIRIVVQIFFCPIQWINVP